MHHRFLGKMTKHGTEVVEKRRKIASIDDLLLFFLWRNDEDHIGTWSSKDI
jgi:hypothetical protein